MPRLNSARSFLMLTISVAALSACEGTQREAKTAAPMPPITELDAAMSAPAPEPLPLSGSDTLTPVMPIAATAVTEVVATPPAGETIEQRMARLEQSVVALRSDYNRLAPAFASLNTTNDRIQHLLAEIEATKKMSPSATTQLAPIAPAPAVSKTMTVTRAETVPATGVIPAPGSVSTAKSVQAIEETVVTTTSAVSPATVPLDAPPLSAFKEQSDVAANKTVAAQETAQASTTAATPPATGASSVSGLRIGEHGTRTRLVFDLATKTKPEFRYDLDNGEKILLVEMPSSAWNGKISGTPKSPLIGGWSVDKGAAGGSAVAIQLKKEARVLSTEFLKAEGKDPARLVMDIGPNG